MREISPIITALIDEAGIKFGELTNISRVIQTVAKARDRDNERAITVSHVTISLSLFFFCRNRINIRLFDDAHLFYYWKQRRDAINVYLGASRSSRLYLSPKVYVPGGWYYDKVLLISVDCTQAEDNWPRREHSLNGKPKCISAS